jgi:hypothetical protein
MFGLMTKRPKKPEEVSELWRDLCEKVLGELKRRGFDLDQMSDAESASLLTRLAQTRPDVTERQGAPSASSRFRRAR